MGWRPTLSKICGLGWTREGFGDEGLGSRWLSRAGVGIGICISQRRMQAFSSCIGELPAGSKLPAHLKRGNDNHFSVPLGLRGRLGSFMRQGSEGRLAEVRSPRPSGFWSVWSLVPQRAARAVRTQLGREWRPARVPEARLRV